MGKRPITWLGLFSRRWKENQQPEQTEQAVVLSKRWTNDNVGWGDTRDGGQVRLVTFETASGTVLELRMGRTDYVRIREGDRGILTWQGQRGWNFVKETE